jgi:hypothetical protein
MKYWEILKDKLFVFREKTILYYGITSRVFFALSVLMYIACCMVAGDFVGPIGFIRFLGHICDWKVR